MFAATDVVVVVVWGERLASAKRELCILLLLLFNGFTRFSFRKGLFREYFLWVFLLFLTLHRNSLKFYLQFYTQAQVQAYKREREREGE